MARRLSAWDCVVYSGFNKEDKIPPPPFLALALASVGKRAGDVPLWMSSVARGQCPIPSSYKFDQHVYPRSYQASTIAENVGLHWTGLPPSSESQWAGEENA